MVCEVASNAVDRATVAGQIKNCIKVSRLHVCHIRSCQSN